MIPKSGRGEAALLPIVTGQGASSRVRACVPACLRARGVAPGFRFG
jgi:hypothetical protein